MSKSIWRFVLGQVESGVSDQKWSSYNRALIARGSLTVWLDDSLWRSWYAQGPSQRGAQFVYSDLVHDTKISAGSASSPPTGHLSMAIAYQIYQLL